MMSFQKVFVLTVLSLVTSQDVARDGRVLSSTNKMSLPWNYPAAKYDSNTYDVMHGKVIRDPYRWLENQTSAETTEFWTKNNDFTNSYLEQSPHKSIIENNFKKLLSAPEVEEPSKHGDYYYYLERKSLQGNSVLYRKSSLDAKPEELFNPNLISPSETGIIRFTSFSSDDKYVVLAYSRKGSDWTVFDVYENNEKFTKLESLVWTRDESVTWSTDNKGFFFSTFPAPKDTPLENAGIDTMPGVDNKLWYHRIGTQQKDDLLLFENKEDTRLGYSLSYAGNDNQYLVVSVARSTEPISLTYYADATESNKNGILARPNFIKATEQMDGSTDYLQSIDSKTHYFMTSRNAPYLKVVKGSFEDLKNAKDYLPEQKGFGLQSVVFGKKIVAASYIKAAYYHIKVFSINGDKIEKEVKSVQLPVGSLNDFTIEENETKISYSMGDFFYSSKSYEFDIYSSTNENKLVATGNSLPGINPDLFETRIEYYYGWDSNVVPITLVHKKGIKKNNNNFLYLHAYGGFNAINTASVNAHWLNLLQSFDVMIAIAHIRGGGENGLKWHQDGSRMKRQNSYNDFYAAAQWVCDEGYTQHSKIVVNGRSNGGTLSAVSLVQNPWLFGAVITDVGVMDLTRYQLFHDGSGWFDDFGDAINNATEFRSILTFSPYHNVRPYEPYPPVLINTGTHDDRVSFLHSMKLAAKIQSMYKYSQHPSLLQVTNNTGHACTGCGLPTGLYIEIKTNILTFISMVFNIVPKRI